MASDEPMTQLELRALREMREHGQEHKAAEGTCAICDLWRAWNSPGGQKARLKAVDAVIDHYGLPKELPDLPEALQRSIRHDWGEGDWTAGDLT